MELKHCKHSVYWTMKQFFNIQAVIYSIIQIWIMINILCQTTLIFASEQKIPFKLFLAWCQRLCLLTKFKALLIYRFITRSTCSFQVDVWLKGRLVHVFFHCLKENNRLKWFPLKPHPSGDWKFWKSLHSSTHLLCHWWKEAFVCSFVCVCVCWGFFGHTSQFVGSYFHHQELNLSPQQWKRRVLPLDGQVIFKKKFWEVYMVINICILIKKGGSKFECNLYTHLYGWNYITFNRGKAKFDYKIHAW